MGLCELETCYTISELRKKMIYSSDNLRLGRIIDVVFDKNNNLHSFILGGSRWEELREQLGFIDDIDPVILASDIKEIKDKEILLKIPKDKIRHKLEDGVIPEKAHTYRELKRKKVSDFNNKEFGNIVNLAFIPSGEAAFIIGGNWLEEFAERMRFTENVDLLLPLNHIDSIDHSIIKITTEIDKLEKTVDDKPLDEESTKKYLNSLKIKGELELRLLQRVKPEEFVDPTRFH
ncbi:MAG: hypothetical protein FK734_02520 [Asgard group archaeon]|nr:hypothetical protein [Asgard group archaeon]